MKKSIAKVKGTRRPSKPKTAAIPTPKVDGRAKPMPEEVKRIKPVEDTVLGSCHLCGDELRAGQVAARFTHRYCCHACEPAFNRKVVIPETDGRRRKVVLNPHPVDHVFAIIRRARRPGGDGQPLSNRTGLLDLSSGAAA